MACVQVKCFCFLRHHERHDTRDKVDTPSRDLERSTGGDLGHKPVDPGAPQLTPPSMSAFSGRNINII